MCSEFDAYTGSKIASVDIGSPVVRMAYSPTAGHSLIAVLEVSFLNCNLRLLHFAMMIRRRNFF